MIGLPAIIRPAFTLGGTGGGVAYNRDDYEHFCRTGLDASPVNQILIDESLLGWKEFEMEVVRDTADNAIIVCAIENVDPDGRAYRRLDHRGPCPDADRQRISDDAHGQYRRAARNRRRDRRLQRAMGGEPRRRAHGGD